jgi:hypothetical protein
MHHRYSSEPVNDEQKSAYRLFVDRLSGRKGQAGPHSSRRYTATIAAPMSRPKPTGRIGF